MPVSWMVGIAFVVLAGCLVAAFAIIALDARKEEWETVYPRAGRLRKPWFIGLLALAVATFTISMTWLPYAFARRAELPGEATQVAVMARQFSFEIDTDCIPDNAPVEFAVQSHDVNHGFAIYDPEGHVVGQVQAMPGFTNTLRLSLSKPGKYTILCNELCGPAHAFMRSTINVGCGSASAGCGGGSCA